MIPGMGGNPRQMAMMMKQLGIDVEELGEVDSIVIKAGGHKYTFKGASVSIMRAKGGVETWQISGTAKKRKIVPKDGSAAPEPSVPEGTIAAESGPVELGIEEADVDLVAEQAGVSKDEARKALEAHNGDPAEALVALLDA